MGGAPRLEDIDKKPDIEGVTEFVKRLHSLLKKDRIDDSKWFLKNLRTNSLNSRSPSCLSS